MANNITNDARNDNAKNSTQNKAANEHQSKNDKQFAQNKAANEARNKGKVKILKKSDNVKQVYQAKTNQAESSEQGAARNNNESSNMEDQMKNINEKINIPIRTKKDSIPKEFEYLNLDDNNENKWKGNNLIKECSDHNYLSDGEKSEETKTPTVAELKCFSENVILPKKKKEENEKGNETEEENRDDNTFNKVANRGNKKGLNPLSPRMTRASLRKLQANNSNRFAALASGITQNLEIISLNDESSNLEC